MAFNAKGARGVALVTDAVAVTVAGRRRRRRRRARGPPRLADGTLAGSVLTMDGALANVVRPARSRFDDAVAGASTTPARLLGLDDRGAIAPGRRADLVALEPTGDGAWRVRTVWVGGRSPGRSPEAP